MRRRISKRDLFHEVFVAFRQYTSAAESMNEVIAERIGFNRTDHRCLEILNRKGPMTAGELAEASHLTTGAVTGVLDRLERAGYARRVRDADDRRRVLVEQTHAGRVDVGERYYGPPSARSLAAMQKYSVAQLTTIRDFVREAAQILADYTNEVRGDGQDAGAAGAG